MDITEQTCCFIGHRTVQNKSYLNKQLKTCVQNLITKFNVTTFLFGSHSEFNEFCWEAVTELKRVYTHIKRVYVRAEYEYISDDYENYLLTFYEKTYFADKAHNAKKLVYIKRNEEIIDNSNICVFYCKYNNPHSGTKIAFDYARKHNKKIIELV